MRLTLLPAAAALALGVAGAVLPVLEDTKGQQASPPAFAANGLRPVSAFAAIADERTRAIALFQEAAKVIAHPRCMNCHPAGERPTQTERMQPHQPLVVRGAEGHGAPGMMCATCHHAANYRPAGVPGHADWHLAPLSMAWQGRSVALRADQGSRAQRWPRHGGPREAYGGGLSRRLGVVSGRWPHARARHPGGVRHAGPGLGRCRRSLPGAVEHVPPGHGDPGTTLPFLSRL